MAVNRNGGMPTYESIVRDIRAGIWKPVYYLMGEESYFIDKLSDFIVSHAISEEDRDFNLITLFGADVDVSTIVNRAKAYPMGAPRLVVVVKEAQQVRNIEQLAYYLQDPQSSTVLVLCHKNGSLDRRKKLASEIERTGVLFESKKYKDYQLPAFIRSYMKEHHLAVTAKVESMLTDYVGADLCRLTGELEKLTLFMPKGKTTVEAEDIERVIGVSKDFNYFELQDALVKKDVFKANQIAKYFDENPKNNPIQATLVMLFRFYSKLMLAYYSPARTEKGIAEWIGMSDWQVRENIMPAMRNYSGTKVMRILSFIRQTDARSKGVDNPNTSSGDLLKELLYYILH